MIPDRQGDSVRSDPLADQIQHANVIRLEWFGGSWTATIGPNIELGLFGIAGTPESALASLLTKLLRTHWMWDSGWIDNLSVYPTPTTTPTPKHERG